jgi:hypothetical protein
LWVEFVTLYTFSHSDFIFFSQKENRVIDKVSLSLGLLSIPSPLFQWDPQSTEVLLNHR